MNEQSKNMDDFDRLLISAMEGELTEDRRRELFARLEAEPALHDRYVDLMLLHSEMQWELAGAPPECLPQVQSLPAAATSRRGPSRSLWVPLILLAAAVLIAAASVSIVLYQGFRLNPPVPQIVERPKPAVNRNADAPVLPDLPPHVATLSASVNARWADRGVILDHAELHPGKLFLSEGAAEITMMSGVRAILQAPCDVELISSNSVRLAKGKLVARVPDRAKGFIVETPTGRITDFGTEFGVKVNGETDVRVFEGEIELAANGQRLKAGQAVRVNKDKQVRQWSAEDLEMQLLRPEGMDKQLAGQNIAAFNRWRAYSAELVKDPNLLAYYTFDNSGDEEASVLREVRGRTEFDGKIIGPIWTRGRFPGKGALEFAGPYSKNRVELSSAASEKMNFTGSYSICLWFKIHSMSAPWQPLISKGGGGWRIQRTRGRYTYVTQEDSKINFSQNANWSNPLAISATRIYDNRWHLAVAVCEQGGASAKARFYVDGQLQAEKQWTSLQSNRFPVWIGDDSSRANIQSSDINYNREYHGLIDELAIFNRALDFEEARRMYEAGNPGADRPDNISRQTDSK